MLQGATSTQMLQSDSKENVTWFKHGQIQFLICSQFFISLPVILMSLAQYFYLFASLQPKVPLNVA